MDVDDRQARRVHISSNEANELMRWTIILAQIIETATRRAPKDIEIHYVVKPPRMVQSRQMAPWHVKPLVALDETDANLNLGEFDGTKTSLVHTILQTMFLYRMPSPA
jgi:hypothetical protein